MATRKASRFNGYSQEYRRMVIEAARNSPPMTLNDFALSLPKDEYGKRPSSASAHKWITAAGVKIAPAPQPEAWTKAQRADAVAAVVEDGQSIEDVRDAMRELYGRAPSMTQVKGWIPKKHRHRFEEPEADSDLIGAAQDSGDRYNEYSQSTQDAVAMLTWTSGGAGGVAEMERRLRKYDWMTSDAALHLDDDTQGAAGDEDDESGDDLADMWEAA